MLFWQVAFSPLNIIRNGINSFPSLSVRAFMVKPDSIGTLSDKGLRLSGVASLTSLLLYHISRHLSSTFFSFLFQACFHRPDSFPPGGKEVVWQVSENQIHASAAAVGPLPDCVFIVHPTAALVNYNLVTDFQPLVTVL